MPQHAHPLEYVWLISALVFMFISTRRLLQSWRYRLQKIEASRVERRINNALLVLQSDDLHNELCRFALGATNLLVATFSLYLAPPPPAFLDQPQMLLLVLMAIINSWIKTFWTLFEERTERRVVAAMVIEGNRAAAAQRTDTRKDD